MDDLSIQLYFKRLVKKNISQNIHLILWHNAQSIYCWITLGTESTVEYTAQRVMEDSALSRAGFFWSHLSS